MKTHGYRSRKELDKERSKKEREAGAYQMIRGTSEVVPLDNFGPVHDSFYDNLKVSVTYPFGAGNGNLEARGKRLDVGLDNHPEHRFSFEEVKTHMDAQEIWAPDHHKPRSANNEVAGCPQETV